MYIPVEDLQKQFTKDTRLTCVLDYMQESQYQKNFIFRNYTVLLQHVFEGLCYLKSQRVVHRDIKGKDLHVYIVIMHLYIIAKLF